MISGSNDENRELINAPLHCTESPIFRTIRHPLFVIMIEQRTAVRCYRDFRQREFAVN
jgi:hypothetical protein